MIRTIIFAVTITAASVASAAPVSAPDRAALEKLAYENDDAWNRNDTKTIAGQFDNQATARVGVDGELLLGRKAIQDYFASSFAGRPDGIRHVTNITALDRLDDRTILGELDIRLEEKESSGSWKLVRWFRTIAVVVRSRDGWMIRSSRAIRIGS